MYHHIISQVLHDQLFMTIFEFGIGGRGRLVPQATQAVAVIKQHEAESLG